MVRGKEHAPTLKLTGHGPWLGGGKDRTKPFVRLARSKEWGNFVDRGYYLICLVSGMVFIESHFCKFLWSLTQRKNYIRRTSS